MQVPFEQFFALSQYTNRMQRRHAQTIASISLMLFIVSVGLISNALLNQEGQTRLYNIMLYAVALGASLSSIALVRGFHLDYAALPLIIFLFFSTIYVLLSPELSLFSMTFVWVGILIAAIIASPLVVLSLGGASCVVVLIGYFDLRDTDPNANLANLLFLISMTILGTGVAWLVALNQLMGASSTEQPTRASQRRMKLIETSNAVTARIFSRMDLEILLDDIVEMIREQFDEVYHAQVFLLDDAKGDARLRASTGEIGERLISRGHSLKVGSQSVIGQVTSQGIYVLARDTSRDPIHRHNELLPQTRTELALPLKVGRGIIGALDVQSRLPDAFTSDDIDIFQTLADQIAVAIDNATLVDDLQAKVDENLRLYRLEQHGREEIERLNRDLVQRGWVDYLKIGDEQAHWVIDLETGDEMSIDASNNAEAAMETNQVTIVSDTFGQQRIAMPIIVQGVSIGALEFEISEVNPVSEAVQEAMRVLSVRIGEIAENARLFGLSRSVAARQEQLNLMTSKLQGLSGVDALLETAVSEFGQTIGASKGYIRLVSNKFQQGRTSSANGSQLLDQGPAPIDDEWIEV
jgi:GAF domain-containing protein